MEFTLIFTWWILLLILSLIGLPITSSLFWRLSDKGASAALTFSLTALFFSIYWLGHFSFSLSTVLLGLATLVLLSMGVLFVKRPELPLKRFSESFAVFTMAFMLIVAIRSADPSIYPIGGEKFLDFGLLQSILRSSVLPPEDLWFAGETVRYYYGGHLISAILSMLSGISAKFAYNLALASFFGALVSGAYGLSGSLSTFYGHSHRFAGSLGAIIVGISSNFVVAFSIFLWVLPLGLANSIARFVGNTTDLKPLYLLHPDSFFYWTSSRVIRGTINEFPFFAWLNGDLHAHMMSTPFMILILFTMFAYYLSPANSVRERRLLILIILPLLSGLLAVVNTWSYPTVFGLLFLTLVFSPTDPVSDVKFFVLSLPYSYPFS
jgi:YYY domain-containing protein